MSGDNQSGSGLVERRKFLKLTGAGAASAGLAGCGQGDQGTATEGDGTAVDTPTETEEPTPTPTENPDTVTETEGIPTGGVFTVGLPQPPKGINILSTSSAYSAAIYDLVYESGVAIDPVTYEIQPNVFTDWTIENIDSGKPDVYVNVRTDAGLTWTDGESFGMDDVIFTYNYLLDQQPGKYVSSLDPIDSVQEADNDWDVQISMNQVVGTYDSTQLTFPILPEHIWSEQSNYQEYQPGQMVDQGRPVGLGPATVTSYQPDTSIGISLRGADEYKLSNLDWVEESKHLRAGGPFLEEVRYKVFTSQSARIEALFNGDVDSIYSDIPSSATQRGKDSDRIDLIQGSDTGFGYVAFNTRREPFDDVAFRQMFGFLWDDIYWTNRLNSNRVFEGDFVMPPAYSAVRPESAQDGAERMTDPATQAFHFRQSSPGVADFEGIRTFLTEGNIITGEGGTYVGQEYPGSLTGVTASQTEAKHDYSFGEVQSQVLKDYGASKEIRVNGQTIPELRGGPLEYHTYPPQLVPELTKMDENYTQNMKGLGIPVERKVISFNSLITAVFGEENFDITHLGWGDLSPFGVSSLYNLYHSDNADDHKKVDDVPGASKKNASSLLNNQMGYGGADTFVSKARKETDPQIRNALIRKAVERIYLDFPVMVFDYDKLLWPVDGNKFSGFIGGIAGPGDSALPTQILNTHLNE